MARAHLDHNATTPVDERVARRQYELTLALPGNPSSLHAEGREARRVLEEARRSVAARLAADTHEVVFTASATEANNTAVFGLAAARPGKRRIVAGSIEHPSVVAPLRRLEAQGHRITWLPVDSSGRLDLEAALAALDEDVAFVTAMSVNNETGVRQPAALLAEACRTRGIPFHCDRVQEPGKAELRAGAERADLETYSAHKFNGPKGVGILVRRAETRWSPLILGGGQERESRAGTENVPAIAAAALALELALDEAPRRIEHRRSAERRLRRGLEARAVPHVLNSGDADRVPGTLSLRFPGLYGETLLMNLDLRGVSVSLGSACSSGAIEASPVLRAMGLDPEANFSSLRVSIGHETTDEEVDLFVDAMAEIARAEGKFAP
ncbi:MAG: cysteine desulfurase family protein [Planctomycetota bacterium]